MTFAELGSVLSFLIVLLFILFALSLAASMLVETAAGMLASRGKMLRQRLLDMFDDSERTGFGELLLNSPLIRSMAEGKRFPSYIPAETFSRAVMAILHENGFREPGDLPPVLRALALSGGLKTEKQREELQQEIMLWYDRVTERLTGKFRRMTRTRLFLAGLFLAVTFNIDMITVASDLWEKRMDLDEVSAKTATLHTELNDILERTGQPTIEALIRNDPEEGAKAQKLIQKLLEDDAFDTITLPIGWDLTPPGCQKPTDEGTSASASADAQRPECSPWRLPSIAWNALISSEIEKVIGWFLSALLVIPGAAFWFDVIGKVVSLRSAGLKPPAPTGGQG